MSERSPEMEAYNILGEADQFSLSKQKFESLVLRLSSEETSRMDHSALESLVERDGREILRQLYQDHQDLRASICILCFAKRTC